MLSTERRKQYAWGLIGLLTAFLIVVSVYAIQATNRAAASIEDCTTLDGGCYKRQARATGQAVMGINLSTIFTATCALDGVRGDVAMVRCVERRVERYMREIRP
jgi:hypothetical protein